ncbi:MAG: hypothetical protein LUE20_07695, partial [Oscillospiraceae bacterium]|nr:hypothetical protein [Oscillospiraceae bacterium]
MLNRLTIVKKAMKRSKKRNEGTPRQLCLFETPSIRQEEENRRTQKRKPVEASKTAAPTFLPPAPGKALKQPENALQTEIPDREELNCLWKVNPEALHTLNQMAKKNPAVLTLVRRLGLVPLCLLLLFACAAPSGREMGTKTDSENKNAPAPTIRQAVSLLAVLEGWHDPEKTGCTGWGHRACYDGTRVTTPTEADSLAAADLRALSARFRGFQGDSLLLALLAYNVGVKAVKTSSLMDSLSFD